MNDNSETEQSLQRFICTKAMLGLNWKKNETHNDKKWEKPIFSTITIYIS